MSNTLIIKHLCGDLEVSEREDFLKLFGATKVWFIKPDGHTAFASFETKEATENALYKLHQLEVSGKRLSVEYANDKVAPQTISTSETGEAINRKINNLKGFIDKLYGRNTNIDFTQPVPPNICYKYPPANPHTLFNIMHSLAVNVSFYTQTLHLMNKMNLSPPFNDVNDSVKMYILDCLHEIGIYEVNNHNSAKSPSLSSDESEISYVEDSNLIAHETPLIKPFKRKSTLKISKRVKLPKVSSKPHVKTLEKKIVPCEIFEVPVHKSNKIEININQTLQNVNISNDAEVVGTINKMDAVARPEETSDKEENISKDVHIISEEELKTNRISSDEMKSLPVFKNYDPGAPSMRLYIKNLAKGVSTADIESIYLRYVSSSDSVEKEIFDVRVMQEGRMKGQAFVTLPSIEICERALKDTNGFMLKNKPMVVQFARSANKS